MGKEDAPFTMTDGEHELDMVYVFVCWGGGGDYSHSELIIRHTIKITQPVQYKDCSHIYSLHISTVFIVEFCVLYVHLVSPSSVMLRPPPG